MTSTDHTRRGHAATESGELSRPPAELPAGVPQANGLGQHGEQRSDTEWLRAILTAPVYDVAQRTPLTPATRLSARLGARIWFKREDQQPVFSFKLRGAYNKIARLTPEQRRRGVLAVSAGNHAQGVALAGSKLGIHSTIVMPVTTPPIKVDAVRALGAEIVLHGDSYDAAARFGFELCQAQQKVWIHPFDDDDVIAGQGTVAMELIQQCERLDAVFVPVGGGGLAAGMAVYLKALRPEIRLIAVEPVDAACLGYALKLGRPAALAHVGLFVDGCAVKQVGDRTFELLRHRVDDVVLVDTDQVCAAIKDIFEDTRSIVEPAGALAVAGMKQYALRHASTPRQRHASDDGKADDALGGVTEPESSQHWVAVLSGANMNFDRLLHVTERAEVGEQREALFGVSIPERRGSFLEFCRSLGSRAITEFNYRYCAQPGHGNVASAEVYVGIKLKHGTVERTELSAHFRRCGYTCQDHTDNEAAKLHVRHLLGGRAPNGLRERLIRFEFPERPGALLDFLESLGPDWNITLFHYRNHGAAYGRVLCGFELGPEQDAALERVLARLAWRFEDETENPALRQFLAPRE